MRSFKPFQQQASNKGVRQSLAALISICIHWAPSIRICAFQWIIVQIMNRYGVFIENQT